jgi:hypothetical protein
LPDVLSDDQRDAVQASNLETVREFGKKDGGVLIRLIVSNGANVPWASKGLSSQRVLSRRQSLASLPLERLLTETDGPFTQINGRPARPAEVASTVAKIADLRSLSSEETGVVISNNLKR